MSTQPSFDHDELFGLLIFQFQQSAMVGMGKLQNPVTGKTQRNLAEARFSIDMLEMLQEMTEGHRSKEHDMLLQQVLTNLRLNFVEEQKKPDPAPDSETSDPSSQTPDAADTSTSEPPDTDNAE